MNQIGLRLYLPIMFFLLAWNIPAFAFSPLDVNVASSAYNSDFYIQNGTNGYFKNDQFGGVTYFWSQAEQIECIIDAYEWTSNSTYKSMITNLLNGFISNNGSWWYAGNG